MISDEQAAEAVALLREHGTIAAAHRASGLNWHTLHRRLVRAAERGLDGAVPEPIARGRRIKGVSTLYDRNGNVAAQWVKDTAEPRVAEDVAEAFRDAFREWRGHARPRPAPAGCAADLLTVYPVVDHHHGLYAWGAETGASYDVATSAALLHSAMESLIARAPPSAEAVLLILGDFCHADDSTARTPASGHALDVDTRHSKVLRSGVEMLVRATSMLASKHERVTVRVLPGNHDPHAALAVSVALEMFFAREPRVTVDPSPSLWWFKRWGRVLLGATHGHNIKPGDMPAAMAAAVPEWWGATVRRRVYFGHYHGRAIWQGRGATAEGFEAMTARDAYAAGCGFFSDRAMHAITHDRTTCRETRVVEALDVLDLEALK